VGGWNGSKLRHWWWIAFILGALVINYPILHIFARELVVFGIPVLFLYLVVGWLTSIAVIALYAWVLRKAPPGEDG
jgi:hypothetical protein